MTQCPGRDLLLHLLAGANGDVADEDLVRHLEVCSDCQQALESLMSADWVAHLEGWPTLAPVPPPQPDSFLRRLQQAPPWRDEPARGNSASPGPGTKPPGLAAWPGAADATPDDGHAGRAAPEVPGYEILGELGRGGMGVVYLARRVRLDRPCALKMILAGAHADPEVAARFLAEARATAQLQHSHVVQIYHVGEADGLPFLELEYVLGGSLDRQLAGIPWTPGRAARLAEQLARGIAEAHRLGIIHRDLKPGNVLLTGDGAPKITDFGLAKALGSDSGLTRSDSVLGSPSYMAPEQADGRASRAGPAADIYAVGAILYELLTGRPPFRGPTMLATLEQVKTADPVPPSRLVPGLPHDLETIVLKCLAKEPSRRYHTATELADDLGRIQAGEPIRGRRVGGPERAWRWCRRNPVVAGLVGGIALALVLGTAVSTVLAIRADREGRRAREAKTLGDRRLYLAEIHLAQQAWQAGRPDLVEQHLLRAIESRRPEDPDPRDFEWYYLRRQSAWGRALRGHDGWVRGVAFSPGGRTVASAGQDGTVRIWDTVTDRVLKILRGHKASVMGVAFSPDGRTIASAGCDRTAKIWDAATGHELRTLRGHKDWVRGVAYSPDGRTIASAGNDRTVRIWDVATGQPVQTLFGHAARVTSVVYGPDGRTVASACDDGTVKLWDVATGREPRTFHAHAAEVLAVAYGPDGRTLASASADGTVKIWDADTARMLHALSGHKDWVRGVAYGPDGRTLASASYDGTVKIWDTGRGQVVHSLDRRAGYAYGVAYSPDGRRIASAGADGTVRVMVPDLDRESLILRGHVDIVLSVAFSPDGRTLASTGVDRAVRIWDIATGLELRTLRGHTANISGVAYSPDGRTLASASFDHMAKLWDVATGRELRTLHGHASTVYNVAFSPDGRTLATAGADRAVRIWDVATGHELLTLRRHESRVIGVAYRPDGRTLASAGLDHVVKIWDADTGRELRTLRGIDARLWAVAYSPDGHTLASVSHENTSLTIWDADTGRLLRTLSGHEGGIWGVAFSPDGRRIASASADRTIRIWDADTGQELLVLPGHGGVVRGVAFGPDGRTLASCSDDRTVKLWEAAPPSPEEQAPREARGVVAFLFSRSLTAVQVRERIQHDLGLNDEVRRRALALVEPYGRSVPAYEAERTVDARFAAGMFRSEVQASLRGDPSLGESVRRHALELVGRITESPERLRAWSWSVVRRPDAEPAAYDRALRQAELACRLIPQDGESLTTLGVAHYRVGNDREAAAALTLADRILAHIDSDVTELCLVVLALAQHRLGNSEEARTTLERLRAILEQPGWVQNRSAFAFSRELDALQQDLAFPADPFAP